MFKSKDLGLFVDCLLEYVDIRGCDVCIVTPTTEQSLETFYLPFYPFFASYFVARRVKDVWTVVLELGGPHHQVYGRCQRPSIELRSVAEIRRYWNLFSVKHFLYVSDIGTFLLFRRQDLGRDIIFTWVLFVTAQPGQLKPQSPAVLRRKFLPCFIRLKSVKLIVA